MHFLQTFTASNVIEQNKRSYQLLVNMKYVNLGSINTIQAFNETWVDFFFNSAQRLVLLLCNVHAFQRSSNSNDCLYTVFKMTIKKALYAIQKPTNGFHLDSRFDI